MTERSIQIDEFLAAAGLSDCSMNPLAGDASNRRYFRIKDGDTLFVLMDAPPTSGEDIRPFVRIAQWLVSNGFSPPRVFHQDDARGLLLLEDLGDDLIARVVETNPNFEVELYRKATDVLARLHECSPPSDLVEYTPELMSEMTSPVFDWYMMGAEVEASKRNDFEKRFGEILDTHCSETNVVVLRDYHAENLLWLPERDGVAQVGLLDFQDALLGHRAYDLVSLLHDIRREVPKDIEEVMIQRYLNASGLNEESLRAAYSALGVQRNLRIMGVFARLCLHGGRPGYIDFLPRVWDLIQGELSHPALAKVRPYIMDTIPPPTDPIRKILKNKCATTQTP